MKKFLQTAACAAFGLLAIGAGVCPAQPGRMVGGYREAAKTDETVIAAANFAVETQTEKDASLKLIAILKAERQIVAGSNYRMCLAVSSKGKPEQAQATVYHNLKNEFSLSDWTPGKCGEAESADDSQDESVSYKGKLEVGKTSSTILYVGEESGDYAAFCFDNNSEAGRAVLAACKTGEQCEFVGKVDFEVSCQVKNLEATLSASGKITKIESVKSLARKSGAAVKTVSVSNSTGMASDAVIKNLYAARKSGGSPFFQNKNRALVDKYFTKDFADLIWQDAVEANGEVGAIDFDPLYHAQTDEVTAFKIGRPMIGEGNSELADVPVTFKIYGTEDTILFRLLQDKNKAWKISDIYYPRAKNDDPSSLKTFLTEAANAPVGDTVRGKLTTGKTASVILYFGKESGDYAAYCFDNNSEAGRAVLAACKTGEQCEVTGEVDNEAACKVPGLTADLSAHGKILKVAAVKKLTGKQ